MSLPFEQLPKESNKAFAAFSLYLSLGPQRSTQAVADKLEKSAQLVRRWAAKFDWTARVAAHGAHLAIVEREATAAMVRMKAAGWVKRREELLETEWEMHERAIAAARKALAAFMEREKVYANLADIARMLEVASKMGRLAAGLATDRTEVEGEVTLNLEFEEALRKVYGPQEPAVDVEVVAPPAIADKEGGKV